MILIKTKFTLESAPFSLKSLRPYKLVKIRSESFSPPNFVLVCFGGTAAAAAADWFRIATALVFETELTPDKTNYKKDKKLRISFFLSY